MSRYFLSGERRRGEVVIFEILQALKERLQLMAANQEEGANTDKSASGLPRGHGKGSPHLSSRPLCDTLVVEWQRLRHSMTSVASPP
mmetsp:Transcript_20922/g.28854  ORF Transcript_20922/g.28854 Transcript_20922/m.28854 type:complete len:87 (-) Transcript_20922:1372-1632(-)